MGLFDEMANAKVQNRGAKIREPEITGATQEFVVSLEKVRLQQSNQGFKTLFVVEFKIIEGTAMNPPRSERSWVQMPEHRTQTDPGNCKAFAAAVRGVEPVEVSSQDFDDLVAGKYQGTTLRLEVEKVETKGGRDYWVHTWRPADITPTDMRITREAWLSGAGEGVPHPTNSAYEYNPDHTDWGVRKVS